MFCTFSDPTDRFERTVLEELNATSSHGTTSLVENTLCLRPKQSIRQTHQIFNRVNTLLFPRRIECIPARRSNLLGFGGFFDYEKGMRVMLSFMTPFKGSFKVFDHSGEVARSGRDSGCISSIA